MRVVRHHEHGGPDVLVVDEAPIPTPGDGELLVEVEAVGVGLPSVRSVRRGADLPGAPSGEVCGRVVAGEGLRVGQRVAAVAFGAAYAEYAVVRTALTVRVPDDVRAVDAVALVRGGQVALGALVAGAYETATSVAVTAAGGGVGHLAIQLAAAAPACTRVVAVVGDDPPPEKTAFLHDIGASEVATYAGEPWEPVDLVADGVGGEVQARCLDGLAPLGRLVVYGARGAPVDANELRVHGQTVVGFSMIHVARRPQLFRERAEALWALHRSGRLRPRTETFPLADAAGAHRRVEARSVLGKPVLLP